MKNEIWVLLWSKRQNCFHIETVDELCRKNTGKMHEDGVINDYHPIHIGSREVCEGFAKFNRGLLAERDQLRV